MKKIVYVDLDGVIADFEMGIKSHPLFNTKSYLDSPDKLPGLFESLPPIKGALHAVNYLLDSPKHDLYILSTAPWDNPEAWMHKRLWVEKHFEPNKIRKRLILSHRKDLLKGDYLIDDRAVNGAKAFDGKWIHFGQKAFPNWDVVLAYLTRTLN